MSSAVAILLFGIPTSFAAVATPPQPCTQLGTGIKHAMSGQPPNAAEALVMPAQGAIPGRASGSRPGPGPRRSDAVHASLIRCSPAVRRDRRDLRIHRRRIRPAGGGPANCSAASASGTSSDIQSRSLTSAKIPAGKSAAAPGWPVKMFNRAIIRVTRRSSAGGGSPFDGTRVIVRDRHGASPAPSRASRGGAAELSAAMAGQGSRSDPLHPADRPFLASPDEAVVPQGYTVVNVPAGPPSDAAVRADQLDHLGAYATFPARRRIWTDGGVPDHPDLAHAHFWMPGIAAQLAARVHRVPTVQTFPNGLGWARSPSAQPNWSPQNPCPPCHLGGGNLHRGSARTRPARPASHPDLGGAPGRRPAVLPRGLIARNRAPAHCSCR